MHTVAFGSILRNKQVLNLSFFCPCQFVINKKDLILFYDEKERINGGQILFLFMN